MVERIDVREAARRCGLADYTFRVRQREGWPEMGGQRLAQESELTGPGGLTRHTFDPAAVDRLAELLRQRPFAPGWLDEETFQDADGSTLLTEIGAHKRFKLPRRSIRRWPGGCRFLPDGRAIEHRDVRPAIPRARALVRVYGLADLQQIATAYKSRRRPGPYRDPEGRTWLRASEIRRRYRIEPDSFIRHWAGRDSRHRPGPALRSQKVPNAIRHKRGSPAEVTVYLQEDVERCLRGEETRHPGTGRPCRSRDTFEDRERRARQILRQLLAEGPRRTPDVRQAAQEQGISEGRLWRAARALGVQLQGDRGRNVPLWWCLPGQQPPASEGAPTMRSAARDSIAEPVAVNGKPLQDLGAYPVYIVQPLDQPVPVQAVGVLAMPSPATARGNANPFVSLGSSWKDRVIVCGREKELTFAEWRVVQALLEAGPDGLSLGELQDKAGGRAAKVLNALTARDPDWRNAVPVRPEGRKKGDRYCLRWS